MEPEERLSELEKEGQFGKTPWIGRLAQNFMGKARHNLQVMNLLISSSENEKVKEALKYPEDFDAYDWAINASLLRDVYGGPGVPCETRIFEQEPYCDDSRA